MENKSKYVLLLAFLLFIATVLCFYGTKVNLRTLATDSGFDSSWDSGGWDSGSDWSSSDWGSSSYDHDWGSSSYHSSGSSSNGMGFMFLVFLFIFLALVISISRENQRNSRESQRQLTMLSENENAINEILKVMPNFDKENFYDLVYDIFVKVQEAWMNFDYETLRTLLTDELYNTYCSQLKTLSVKHQKNVMSDFERIRVVISDFKQSNKEYTISVKMQVKFYDYLATEKGNVLRGTNKKRLVMSYVLTFVKSISEGSYNCPNCGAKLEDVNSSVCPYCRSTIVSDKHDYVLSKKEAIAQRFE